MLFPSFYTSGSGSTDPNESGSDRISDPHHWYNGFIFSWTVLLIVFNTYHDFYPNSNFDHSTLFCFNSLTPNFRPFCPPSPWTFFSWCRAVTRILKNIYPRKHVSYVNRLDHGGLQLQASVHCYFWRRYLFVFLCLIMCTMLVFNQLMLILWLGLSVWK